MIITKLDPDDLPKLKELAHRFYQETYHSERYELVENKLLRVLTAASTNPSKFFLAYAKNEVGEVEGIIAGIIVEHLFSDAKLAQDMGLYVVPEKRGSSLGPRLIQVFEQWSKEQNTDYTVIYHDTGINTDKVIPFFKKLGYLLRGHILVKENK